MGTSYDPTTYLNQQATIAPFTSRVASAAGRLRSSRITGDVKYYFTFPISAAGTYPRFQCKLLDVVVLMFSVMMAVAGAKEPQIAGRAAIRVLKQHMVKEPIFEAASSRSKELFAAAIGTTRDLSLRSGFVHGKTLYWGPLFYA